MTLDDFSVGDKVTVETTLRSEAGTQNKTT